MINDVWASFHVPVGHVYVIFGKMSIQVSCPFFNKDFLFVCLFFMLIFMNCLCILDINPLLVISFTNIFSHSVGCLLVSSMTSFAVKKLLNLIRSNVFIFAFISFV